MTRLYCPTCGRQMANPVNNHPLAKLRRERGLTLRELGDIAGVVYAAVSRFERGKDVYTSTAVKIARALGVSVESLLLPEEKP